MQIISRYLLTGFLILFDLMGNFYLTLIGLFKNLPILKQVSSVTPLH